MDVSDWHPIILADCFTHTRRLAASGSDELEELPVVTRCSCCFQLISTHRPPGFSVLTQALPDFLT
ncbi:unnamed protein product [Schistosoma intercalatum]|nr:unnamed protein product [Schistosoma intercalatum]